MKLPAQLLQCLAALLSIALVACSHQVGPFPQATFGHRLDMVHSQILFTTTVPVGSKDHGHLHTEQQCVAGLQKSIILCTTGLLAMGVHHLLSSGTHWQVLLSRNSKFFLVNEMRPLWSRWIYIRTRSTAGIINSWRAECTRAS